MDERVLQFRVGIMILASILICAILVVLFHGSGSLWKSTYGIDIRLPEARGVTEGTPVRKRGIVIGRVTKVRLEDDGVVVTAEIDADVTIYKDETALVRGSLLGDAELEIVPRQSLLPKDGPAK